MKRFSDAVEMNMYKRVLNEIYGAPNWVATDAVSRYAENDVANTIHLANTMLMTSGLT